MSHFKLIKFNFIQSLCFSHINFCFYWTFIFKTSWVSLSSLRFPFSRIFDCCQLKIRIRFQHLSICSQTRRRDIHFRRMISMYRIRSQNTSPLNLIILTKFVNQTHTTLSQSIMCQTLNQNILRLNLFLNLRLLRFNVHYNHHPSFNIFPHRIVMVHIMFEMLNFFDLTLMYSFYLSQHVIL